MPAEHHRVTADADGVALRVPAITALQLYHDGTLWPDGDNAVKIRVAGKILGRFSIESLRLVEGHEFGEPLLPRFRRIDS